MHLSNDVLISQSSDLTSFLDASATFVVLRHLFHTYSSQMSTSFLQRFSFHLSVFQSVSRFSVNITSPINISLIPLAGGSRLEDGILEEVKKNAHHMTILEYLWRVSGHEEWQCGLQTRWWVTLSVCSRLQNLGGKRCKIMIIFFIRTEHQGN